MHRSVVGFRWSSASESILALVVTAAFYALGAVLGGTISACCVEADNAIVRTYLESFLSVLQTDFVRPSFLPFCFGSLRWGVLAFAFGFSSAGVLCVPLLCLIRGFLFSFSVGAFAWNLGIQGLTVAFCALGISGIVVIPTFLLVSSHGFLSAKALLGKQWGIGRAEPVNQRLYCVRGVIILGVLGCILLGEWYFSPVVLSGVTKLWGI